jgi:hypothetical protein
MHEILGSIYSVMPNQSFVFPSTYQVQTRYVQVHTSKGFVIPSTKKYVLSTAVFRYYIPPCTTDRDPRDVMKSEYNSVCTPLRACSRIQTELYSGFMTSLDREPLYKVCTGTQQYKVVLYYR